MMSRKQAKSLAETLLNVRENIPDEQLSFFSFLYPEWKTGVTYVENQRIIYKDIFYKVLIPHTSNEELIPELNPHLFTKISVQ